MDEMYEWLKTRRKRRLRLLAALLGVGVLLTSLPRLPEAIEGALASGQPIRTVREFAPLSKDVREQTVPIGTTFRELDLPDTLEAYIFTENNEKNEGGGGKWRLRRGA